MFGLQAVSSASFNQSVNLCWPLSIYLSLSLSLSLCLSLSLSLSHSAYTCEDVYNTVVLKVYNGVGTKDVDQYNNRPNIQSIFCEYHNMKHLAIVFPTGYYTIVIDSLIPPRHGTASGRNERCFRPRFCICTAILGRAQPGLMR